MNDALIQIEALISNGEGTAPQDPCALIKVSRNTKNAPKSSLSKQTVAFSHYNNLSAQLPIDPKLGRLVEGDVKAQAGQCLKNIKAIMEQPDVDGALIGGAALDPDEFLRIIRWPDQP